MSAAERSRPAADRASFGGFENGTGSAPERHYTPARLAPYSRAIITAQRAGKHPNVYLFAGSDCWNQAEHRRRTHGEGSTLVLPPDSEPEAFIWPCLDSLVLVPGDAEGERVRRLVVALLAAGCRCIVEVRPDPDRPGWDLAPACHYASADDALEVA